MYWKDRIIEPYKDFFWVFYNPLKPEVKEKIDHVFQIIISTERVPGKFLKHLDEAIYEVRITVGGNAYRVFAFFGENRRVILLHGFQKKHEKLLETKLRRLRD